MRIVSWVLLALVGVATLVASLLSANVAYRSAQDQIGPVGLEELAAGRGEVAAALRARRGTAAAFAAAYAVLFLSIVLGPYRRGDRWAWWALLAGVLVLFGLTLLRVPALGTRAGVGTAAVQLATVVAALLLELRRLRA